MPLTDEQVHTEMRKMVDFIRQEAIEKHRELQLKADEDFHIEKAKAVKHEAASIEATAAKRKKDAETSFKMYPTMAAATII